MFRIWCVLCVLGCVGSSLIVGQVEHEEDYADDYDNEIPQFQEDGDSAASEATHFTRWDKLFIALEDSSMRQNMLLDSLEQCSGGMASLRAKMDKLVRGTCRQCLPSMESACQRQTEQATLRLQRGLVQLSEEGAERERRLNFTLQMLLQSSHEEKRLPEESSHRRAVPLAATDIPLEMGHQPTPGPGGSGTAFGSGAGPFPSGLKEQEVTSPLDVATIARTLVSIATELQKVHLQLSKVVEQAGIVTTDRGES